MNVSDAIAARRSIRGFLETPVAPDLIRSVLQKAARSPSGGNLQPWQIYVVGGESLRQLKATMAERVAQAPGGEGPEFDIYPKQLGSPYRERRFQVGEDMYALLGIPREDRAGRLRWFARNYQFFDAPLALFCYVDRGMGEAQWSDLGMFLQTVMLLLKEAGLDSCAQECWAMYWKTVGQAINPPENWQLFCGMAIGYADPDAPVNRLVTQRAPLDDFVRFMDI